MNSKDDETLYDPEEVYDKISKGKLNKKEIGWNIKLGIGFFVIVNLWIIIYSSRLLKIVYTYENDDNLMNVAEFESEITQFGYDIEELSLSILTFCIQESDPTLVNIPLRLSLSNQIMKQRYQVRNYLDILNKIKLPNGVEYKKDTIMDILDKTSNLLRALVPLNIRFEDQPSPISPAPPPYYKPERTNITESELRESKESDSNTFLAAKYLCNNTEYISQESYNIMFKAMELTKPDKLFDLEYLSKFAIENDYIKYESTKILLIFHYIIIFVVIIVTIVLFYFGTFDYFQRNNRIKMMNYCKFQINDLFEKIVKADNNNIKLMTDCFVPVLKIFSNIERICNGIINEYGYKLGEERSSKLNRITHCTREFENYVNLSIKYSKIMKDVIDNHYENVDSKNNFCNVINIIDLIENEEYSDNFCRRNNHFFSKNITNKLLLSGNTKQFSEMLGSMIKSLGMSESKSIYWDIINVRDNSFIPISMVNSLGEIGRSVNEVLSSNWHCDTHIENVHDKSFLIIDFVLNKCVNESDDKFNGNKPEAKLEKVTRYFNYIIAKRMANIVFGGIVVNNSNNNSFDIDYNKTLDMEELLSLCEFDDSQNMESNTLIVPLLDRKQIVSNNLTNNVEIHNFENIKQEKCVLYSCGVDNYHSNIFESVSMLLSIRYNKVDYFELNQSENINDYLKERQGYWLFDVSIMDLVKKDLTQKQITRDYYYYNKNDIEIVLLLVSDTVNTVFEFKKDYNLVDYYLSFKSLLNLNINEKKVINNKEVLKEVEYDYREIIKLFNRPIIEIKPELFDNTDKLGKKSKGLMIKNSTLIEDKIFTFVDIQKKLIEQTRERLNEKNSNIVCNEQEIGDSNENVLCKPMELEGTWENIDILPLNSTRIRKVAEYLLYHRYCELIKDKHKYQEDVTKWPISISKIKRFVSELQNNYHEKNPFHNFHHAVSVSITLNQWLDEPSVKKYVNSLEAYCLIISSLGHDLDHPGLNNDVIIEIQDIYRDIKVSRDEISILYETSIISTLDIYNGISPLENHHASLLFVILNNESCNIFPPLSSIYHEYLRKMAVNAILFTDMEYHKYLGEYLEGLIKYLEYNNENEYIFNIKKNFYLSSLLHSADISNPLMNTEIYLKWSGLIFQEFKSQVKIKEMLGINNMDDCFIKNNIIKQQVGFLRFICIWYFESLSVLNSSIFENSIQNLYRNYDYYLNLSKTKYPVN